MKYRVRVGLVATAALRRRLPHVYTHAYTPVYTHVDTHVNRHKSVNMCRAPFHAHV